MGGPYCETCKHGYFPVSDSIHGECSDPTKQIYTGGNSSACPDITRRSECQNHTGLTVQAAPSDREQNVADSMTTARLMLRSVWRSLDAAGRSMGRSLDAVALETAMELLDRNFPVPIGKAREYDANPVGFIEAARAALADTTTGEVQP